MPWSFQAGVILQWLLSPNYEILSSAKSANLLRREFITCICRGEQQRCQKLSFYNRWSGNDEWWFLVSKSDLSTNKAEPCCVEVFGTIFFSPYKLFCVEFFKNFRLYVYYDMFSFGLFYYLF